MSGQMCWLSRFGSNDQAVLHLREHSLQPWLPYTTFSQYKIPEYPVPGGSKGWSTYQKLRGDGWTLVRTEQAQVSAGFVTPTLKHF